MFFSAPFAKLREFAFALLFGVGTSLGAAPAATQPAELKDIAFVAHCDGSTQRYVMVFPPGYRAADTHDVLIALHGHGSDRWQFVRDARDECRVARDVAAEHGMLYVSPDYRAKTSWMGPKAEADLVQIIDELRRDYAVGRVFICGGSMGGSSALTFAALHPDLIAGVASMNGTANHLAYDNFQDAIRESFGGGKDQIPEVYKQRSAEYWPERFTMPLGITAGGQDQSVPSDSVVRLARVLERMHRPVLLICRENGGHSTGYADGRRILEFAIDTPVATSGPAGALPADRPPTAPASCPAAAIPQTLDEATAWLQMKSFEMIRASHRPMNDSTSAFPPQAGPGYEAFWLRDYAYMLEGNIRAFTPKELNDACRLFIRAQRADGAMVDTIKFDGTPIYMPGMGSMGENPVADGSQFAVDVAWHTYQRTRDVALVREVVEPLIRAMRVVPLNPATRLVHIKPEGYDRCPYGFTDSVRKQGDELFCSLLYVQAARQLGDLLDAAARPRDAEAWRLAANQTADSIRSVFWDESTGLFRAATIKCREHDIWGSAFAVRIGIADPRQAKRISEYFKAHYRELVSRGQVRHTPGGVYWEAACAPDTYQNGAFWATPVGWFVYTLDLVDPALADKTVVDMVRDFIIQKDVNECVIGDRKNVPHYIVSATLPLEGIRAMQMRRARP